MNKSIQIGLQYLLHIQEPDGGWPYTSGGQSSPEPTCLALLALSSTSKQIGVSHVKAAIENGLRWVTSRVDSRGAVLLPGDNEPHWSTSQLVVTLVRLQAAESLRDRCIRWLLSWKGNQMEPQEDIPLNSRLTGWPWINDTFSWVEPTSYAMLALKLSGYGNHARVMEAEELLMDRACTSGGWNYGNRLVLGRQLYPFVPPTALASMALQDVPAARHVVDKGLEVLEDELARTQSTLSLSFGILCQEAFGHTSDEFTGALVKRQRPDGSWRQATHLTALAVLALAVKSGGVHAFKL